MDKKHVHTIDASDCKSSEPFEVQLNVEDSKTLSTLMYFPITPTGLNFTLANVTLEKLNLPTVSNGYEAKLRVTLEESTTLGARAFCNLPSLWKEKGKSHG
ncbi:MAG: class II SORL domain-containing protein [Candidatus Bathyarchaeota archaeon]|nr:class II SORL domain-containing protein [Candidatus Bathyarchaeota archaeon]